MRSLSASLSLALVLSGLHCIALHVQSWPAVPCHAVLAFVVSRRAVCAPGSDVVSICMTLTVLTLCIVTLAFRTL